MTAWMSRGARTKTAIVAAVLAATAASPARTWQMGPAERQPQAFPIAVFGSDERSPIPAKYKDLQEKIGLFFNARRRTVCTAFCVASNVVVTAGHCLLGTGEEQPARLADFWFVRHFEGAREQSRVAGHANAMATQHVLLGSHHLSVHPPIDATRDWALVRLARPACSKGGLPVRVLPIDAILSEAGAQHVFQIAYHRDYLPWRLAYSRPCAVARSFEAAGWRQIERDFAEPEALILHTCDTGGGSSGSPILLDTPAGPQVIGINVGTYEQAKVLMQDGQVKKRLKANTIANTAVASAAFADRLEAFRQAVILATPGELRELQGLLARHQLYAGPVDGNYDAALKAAIEAYEKAEGLPVTGLATRALLQRLGGNPAAEPTREGPKARLRRGRS
ncbi:MAG TPA: peptidoglycan-binding protein [Hyphomicrobiaceae bacterium]|jgi:protease YdgD